MSEGVVLFIFRRDLRLTDNLALRKAIKYCRKNEYKLMLCFVFSSKQIENNDYFSENAFRFMLESLEEIKDNISFFEEDNFYEKIDNVKAIAFNKDYTPYAIQREEKIEKYCESTQIKLLTAEDYTLHPMGSIHTLSKTPYKVFGAFYKTASKLKKPRKPEESQEEFDDLLIRYKHNVKLFDSYMKKYKKDKDVIKGGRSEGMKLLKNIRSGKHKNYGLERDDPSKSTTRLSAYLKFGCLSIREAYYTILKSKSEVLLKQLYWKEFYANISYFFPEILGGMVGNKNLEMNEDFRNRIEWQYSKEKFEKWCKGMTGFPFVDAGMRELNESGFQHNRLRMVTASFLIKDLHIDWKMGEKYFASKLVDYDPASNNGGWQWVAGTGTDASPYFRVFNPMTQHKRFDPECVYVKRWIPELADVPVKDILNWNTKHQNYTSVVNYPEPMLDHSIEAKEVMDLYY
jgi:deoxyribodipyrimidine photo-lyase